VAQPEGKCFPTSDPCDPPQEGQAEEDTVSLGEELKGFEDAIALLAPKKGGGGDPMRRNDSEGRAYSVALSALRAGHPVGLYPEGLRSSNGLHGTQRLGSGAARLALATGVLILPIALQGTDRAWPNGKTFPRCGACSAEFGEPIAAALGRPRVGRPSAACRRSTVILTKRFEGFYRSACKPTS
jgi:1-acyl-sn-glycerol-3-phosphate acyltransferase